MDLASTQNPVHWTSGPATHAADGIYCRSQGGGHTSTGTLAQPFGCLSRGTFHMPAQPVTSQTPGPPGHTLHNPGWVAFTMHFGLVDSPFQPASSIDSLVRVSRRAVSGTDVPSCSIASLYDAPSGGPARPARATIRMVQSQPATSPTTMSLRIASVACPKTHHISTALGSCSLPPITVSVWPRERATSVHTHSLWVGSPQPVNQGIAPLHKCPLGSLTASDPGRRAATTCCHDYVLHPRRKAQWPALGWSKATWPDAQQPEMQAPDSKTEPGPEGPNHSPERDTHAPAGNHSTTHRRSCQGFRDF